MYHFLLILISLTFFNACESVSTRKKAPEPVDTTAPTLKLLGDTNITISLHQLFADPGAKAEDDFDGDISAKITTSGSVDSNSVGSYTITYSISDKAGNTATLKRIVRVTTFANAKLGLLGGSMVKIYKIENNGRKTLMWQEQTSQSYDLAKIARFDTHAESLKSDTLYLIEVSSGKDYDSNNNGIKDTQILKNNGVLRAVVSKKDITDLAQKLNITTLSEIIYEATIKNLKHNFTKSAYLSAQNSVSKELIKDINSDGAEDYKDTLLFNPATNQAQLLGILHNNYNRYTDTIRSGKLPLLNSDQKIVNIDTYDFARAITQNSDKTKLYIADGNSGITIIDKASNKVLSNIKTKDFARHIALSADESIAYVADSKAGLSVVNITSKQIVKSIPTYDANATGDHDARYILLAENGNRLYLAASKSGVLEFDTSTPENPKLIRRYDSPDIAYNIKLSNDERTLFLADGKTGLIAINTEDNTTLGTFNTYGSANGVTLSEDESKAYIADGYKGMVVADISDPANMSYLSHIDTPDFATAITLNKEETKAYIADRKSNIQVVNLDSDPLAIVDSIPTPYRTYAIMLSKDEDYLYAATGTNGVELLSTSTLPNPLIINYIASDYKAYRIRKIGNTLFVPQGKAGLQIVDVKDLYAPQILANYDTDGFTMDIAINGTTAYLADGYKGIKKLDITSLSSPQEIDSVDTDGFTSSIALIPNSTMFIVSDGDKGVKLYDRNSLTLLDTLTPTAKALDITISADGKTGYVALGTSGVMILSIDGNSLEQKKVIASNSYIKHITLIDDKAYLSGGNSQILVMDLKSTTISSSIPSGEFSYNIAMNSKSIFVANGKDGVDVIDKESKKEKGKILCGSNVRDLHFDNGIIYAASSEKGVCLIDTGLLNLP